MNKGILVVLMIDGNKNMKTGKLAKKLHKLQLKELYISKFPDAPSPNSWYRGSKQIDRI